MALIYSGIINLSKIPKELIKENRAGDKIIYVDFAERKSASLYGDTHYLKLYDPATRTSHYIGDFRPRELGAGATAGQEPSAGMPLPESAHRPSPMPSPAAAPDPNSLELQDGDLPF